MMSNFHSDVVEVLTVEDFKEAVDELSGEEFLRLARFLYESGCNRSFGDPKDPAMKWRLKCRIEEWLGI